MTNSIALFVMGVATGTPIWVWGVLVMLTFFGWRASRQRDVSSIAYFFLPLWGVMAITTVAQSGPTATVWFGFVAAYLVGVTFGWRAQGGIILRAGAGRVLLRGEWLTMALLMTIFWLRFVNGAAEAIAPDFAASAPVVATLTFIGGASAGVFMGRSVRTIRAVFLTKASNP